MARTVKWILLFVAFCLATAIAVPAVLWHVKIRKPIREISARMGPLEKDLARMEQRLDSLDSPREIPDPPGAQDRLEDEWVDAYLSVLRATTDPLGRACAAQDKWTRPPLSMVAEAREKGLAGRFAFLRRALGSPLEMLRNQEEWLNARLRLDFTLHRALTDAGLSLDDFENLAETIEWRFLERRELMFLALPVEKRRGYVVRLRALESYDGLLKILEISPRHTALREKYEADRAALFRELHSIAERLEATRTLGPRTESLLAARRVELEKTDPECLRWLFIR